MTDVKEKATNEEKTNKACKPLLLPSHFGNGTSYRLTRQRVNDRNRCAEQLEGPREGVSPVSINITLFSSSYRYNLCYNTH